MAGSLIGTVKDKVELVKAHAPDVVKTGVDTLRAAQEVVAGARREAGLVLEKTKDGLRRTLKEGADKIGQKLANIATPTRKEQAEARKEEVKAKKRAKRSEAAEAAPQAAAPRKSRARKANGAQPTEGASVQ